MGIPQGGVLGLTLFQVVIESIQDKVLKWSEWNTLCRLCGNTYYNKKVESTALQVATNKLNVIFRKK